jgi:phosphoglycolate phosphatase-like HAD superfamily hydrolase
MRTFLFDIDGTLLRSGGAGLQAMQAAMRILFGVETLARVEVRGRTDRAIVRDLFAAHGIDDKPKNWQSFQDLYHAQLAIRLKACPGFLLPGVANLLHHLAKRDDVAIGLLTGNSRSGAAIKLSHFQVDHWFRFGGFGDHHTCRNQVAKEAWQAAVRFLNGSFDPRQVWVVGDTPMDVECGRAIEATTVAVLTGGFDRAAMLAARPDFLLEDLNGLMAIAVPAST